MNWVDNLIASVASENHEVYTLSGVRDKGNFANLSIEEFTKILAKFSKLQQWTADIINHNYSCGAFIIITDGGARRISQQGMFIGPFQT